MIGTKVNNYEIKAIIGEGGMGAVYVAEHPVIDRKVAVKILKRDLAEDKALVARFMNEARAAAAIRHANIIEVHDVGTLPGGQPYLVMELLEGESLAKRIERVKRIRVGDAVEFAYQAATALALAHNKGIVHRDLKPDNLFLVPDPAMPGRERVKVLDFGIAKLRRDFGGGSVKTHTGSIMGTPPYMSPEQCRGITSEIDHRTDIYALGIILYEMLCGAPPFVSEGYGEILIMHVTQAPRPPREVNPGIPAHIERAILRALEKEPGKRFASMPELQAALAEGPVRTISSPGASAVDAMAPTDPASSSQDRVPALREGKAMQAARATTTFSSTTGERTAETADGATLMPATALRRGRLLIGAGVGVAAFTLVLVLTLGGGGGDGTEGARKSAGPSPSSAAASVRPSEPAPIAPAEPPPGPQPAPVVRPPDDETARQEGEPLPKRSETTEALPPAVSAGEKKAKATASGAGKPKRSAAASGDRAAPAPPKPAGTPSTQPAKPASPTPAAQPEVAPKPASPADAAPARKKVQPLVF